MLIAAAVLTLIVAANAFAAGNPQGNPRAENEAGELAVPACEDPAQGETSGIKKPDTGTRPFGAVHEHEADGIGILRPASCSVPLPDAALFVQK